MPKCNIPEFNNPPDKWPKLANKTISSMVSTLNVFPEKEYLSKAASIPFYNWE